MLDGLHLPDFRKKRSVPEGWGDEDNVEMMVIFWIVFLQDGFFGHYILKTVFPFHLLSQEILRGVERGPRYIGTWVFDGRKGNWRGLTGFYF